MSDVPPNPFTSKALQELFWTAIPVSETKQYTFLIVNPMAGEYLKTSNGGEYYRYRAKVLNNENDLFLSKDYDFYIHFPLKSFTNAINRLPSMKRAFEDGRSSALITFKRLSKKEISIDDIQLVVKNNGAAIDDD